MMSLIDRLLEVSICLLSNWNMSCINSDVEND